MDSDDEENVEVPTDKNDHRTHYVSPNVGLRLKYEKYSPDDGVTYPLKGVKRIMGHISISFRHSF